MKEPVITGVRGFKVNKISVAGIDGDLQLGIKNPNNYSFSVYPSNFDVMYSGVHLGKARLDRRVKIKANAEEVYTFNIKSDFTNTNLLDVMKLLRGASFKNELEIKGDLKAGKLLLRKGFPVDLKERISLQ